MYEKKIYGNYIWFLDLKNKLKIHNYAILILSVLQRNQQVSKRMYPSQPVKGLNTRLHNSIPIYFQMSVITESCIQWALIFFESHTIFWYEWKYFGLLFVYRCTQEISLLCRIRTVMAQMCFAHVAYFKLIWTVTYLQIFPYVAQKIRV